MMGEQDRPEGFEARRVYASVEAKLFGVERETPRIGRFTVESSIGRGGMGEVYLAHDPELERKVAIKLLRVEYMGPAEQAKARLMREAQAMAKLSHPNVVSVYDVGTFEDQVYVAMEFVRGRTLSRWLEERERSWREVLEVYGQAGRGMAAAHRAGIVHRDFKPDNVIVGEDGRVRVVDFGLARSGERDVEERREEMESPSGESPSELTPRGARLGTPAYMAPEQHRGEEADHRSDQFSFCVALWRAIYGKAPFDANGVVALALQVESGALDRSVRKRDAPKWLRIALERGLAADPQARFEGMEALLEALERGKGRRRKTVLGILGAVALASTSAGVFVLTQKSERAIRCEQAEEKMEGVWGEAARGAAKRAFLSEGSPREWTELSQRLDQYSKDWGRAWRESCEGDGGDESNEVELGVRLRCLEWRQGEFETLVALFSDPENNLSDKGNLVEEALDPVSSCEDSHTLASLLDPPSDPEQGVAVEALQLELAQARVLRRSGLLRESMARVELLLARAEEIGYGPLESEILLERGELSAEGGDAEEAAKTIRRARNMASAAGYARVVARANAALVEVVGFQQARPERVEEYAEMAKSTLERLGGDLGVEATVQLGISRAYAISGRLEEALAAAKQAAEIMKREGQDVASVHAQMALAYTLLGRYEEAKGPASRAAELIEGIDSSDEVYVYGTQGILSMLRGEADVAVQNLERCAEEAGPKQPHYQAVCLSYLAAVHHGRGDFQEALKKHEEAFAISERSWDSTNPIVGRLRYHRAWTLLELRRLEEAREDFEAARLLWIETHGDEHRALAQPLTGLGEVALAAGDVEEATRFLERAWDLLMREKGQQGGHASEDARTTFAFARVHLMAGGEVALASRRDAAHSLATEALRAYEGLGDGFLREREKIEAWLAKN